jgi:predicted amidohydrolase YtcJ
VTTGEHEAGSIALVNGAVFTADSAQPRASAIGIWRGRVAYVGDDADAARAAAGDGAEVIDLAGRTATPGLIDAHMHPIMYAEFLRDINLSVMGSLGEILEAIRVRAATTSVDEPIIGRAYYATTLAEGRMPTAVELDAVAPDHAVIFVHRSGHEMVVNSRVIREVGYTRDSSDPDGGYLGREADGTLTGLLAENAMEPVNQLLDQQSTGPDYYAALLRRTSESLLSYGITSTTDAHMTASDLMRAYQELQSDSSRPRVRYNLMLGHWQMLEPAEALGIGTGVGNTWLRVNAMKFFLDGTEGQRTAKVSEGFADDPGNLGMWMFPPEQFRERVTRAHNAGFQCAVHAIGDAAVELTLDVFRDAQAANPRRDPRHRIEHASVLRPDLIDRFSREGVIPIPGGRFASNDYRVLIERFGVDRLRWYQPWNALLERNVPVAMSSDAPVQSPDPAKNLWAVVNSRAEHDRGLVMQAEERISLAETLTTYTRNAAFATHEEFRKGTLKPGMLGDVTVFNTDLFAVDPLELDQVKAEITIVDGTVAYRS